MNHLQKILVLLLWSCLAMPSFGQLEGNMWFFGNKFGLDFSSGEPVLIEDSPLEANGGSASYCDAQGNLLFLTNGGGLLPSEDEPTGEIYNRNYELMYDMQGTEGGGYSAQQSSVIFPVPGGNNTYYLFTMEETTFSSDGDIPGQPFGRGLSYFIIDMNANGGLGEVIVADVRVYEQVYESLCAVRHSNGEDIWIIVADSDNFIVFPITSSGVGTEQKHQHQKYWKSQIKVSPDGEKLFFANSLYQFNSATGYISNKADLPAQIGLLPSFSPNSKYLYMADFIGSPEVEIKRVRVDDFGQNWSTKIIASVDANSMSQMQMAPDGHIYYMRRKVEEGTWLERIVCPNSNNPLVEQNLMLLDENEVFFHFPNFTDHIFRDDVTAEEPDLFLGLDFENCDNDIVQLDAENPGMEYIWSTGDVTQSIDVQDPGEYSVTVTNECGHEAEDEIMIIGAPSAELLVASAEYCAGSLITIPLNIEANYPVVISYLNDGNPEIVQLSTPADSMAIYVDSPTVLNFSQVSNGNCSVDFFETFTIDVVSLDTIFKAELTCSVADTGQLLQYLSFGEGCEVVEIVQIDLAPIVDIILPETQYFEEGDSILLAPTSITPLGQSGRWEDEDGNVLCSNCTEYWVVPETTGRYYFIVETATCDFEAVLQLYRISEEKIYIPNVFSPNGDGFNDLFEIFVRNDAAQVEVLRIYDRWGENIFERSDFVAGDKSLAWNGRMNDKDLPPGIFVYYAELVFTDGKRKAISGEVLLMR